MICELNSAIQFLLSVYTNKVLNFRISLETTIVVSWEICELNRMPLVASGSFSGPPWNYKLLFHGRSVNWMGCHWWYLVFSCLEVRLPWDFLVRGSWLWLENYSTPIGNLFYSGRDHGSCPMGSRCERALICWLRYVYLRLPAKKLTFFHVGFSLISCTCYVSIKSNMNIL